MEEQEQAQAALRNHHWASARERARRRWIDSAAEADAMVARAGAMALPLGVKVQEPDATAPPAYARAAEADATVPPRDAKPPPVHAKAAEADAMFAAATLVRL